MEVTYVIIIDSQYTFGANLIFALGLAASYACLMVKYAPLAMES